MTRPGNGARLGLARATGPGAALDRTHAGRAGRTGRLALPWRARALESSGQNGTAERLYRELAGERDYYSLLAARRIGTTPAWTQRPLPRPPVATLRGLSPRPAVQRARELFLLGRPGRARSEWEPVLRNADTATWRAAMLAADWNWYGQAIIWLARAGDWDDLVLRFPTLAQANSRTPRRTQLPPAWLYAVARVETLAAEARSGAGALGLMRLLPDTARGVASSIGYRLGDNSQLFDPAVNIPPRQRLPAPAAGSLRRQSPCWRQPPTTPACAGSENGCQAGWNSRPMSGSTRSPTRDPRLRAACLGGMAIYEEPPRRHCARFRGQRIEARAP